MGVTTRREHCYKANCLGVRCLQKLVYKPHYLATRCTLCAQIGGKQRQLAMAQAAVATTKEASSHSPKSQLELALLSSVAGGYPGMNLNVLLPSHHQHANQAGDERTPRVRSSTTRGNYSRNSPDLPFNQMPSAGTLDADHSSTPAQTNRDRRS